MSSLGKDPDSKLKESFLLNVVFTSLWKYQKLGTAFMRSCKAWSHLNSLYLFLGSWWFMYINGKTLSGSDLCFFSGLGSSPDLICPCFCLMHSVWESLFVQITKFSDPLKTDAITGTRIHERFSISFHSQLLSLMLDVLLPGAWAPVQCGMPALAAVGRKGAIFSLKRTQTCLLHGTKIIHWLLCKHPQKTAGVESDKDLENSCSSWPS